MKKVLKMGAILISGLLVVLFAAVLFINFRGIPSYDVEKLDYTVQLTPEKVMHGKKLAGMLCANCHMNPETGRLNGTHMRDAPPEFGEIYSANITQDMEHGIGRYTDGELVYLLRTGIKRNGNYAPPYMAKLPAMADEDIDASIAFLRSDDELVQAVNTPAQASKPSFITKLLCNVAFKPLPMPEGKINRPDTTDQIALGRYLAHNLDCYSCHSADFKTNDFLTPEHSKGYFGGGNKPLNRNGEVVFTANLTPDSETGIGNWTEERFVKALKYGLKDGEPALQYPMTPYTSLTDYEAAAIFKYLKTIPAIKNKVNRAQASL